MTIEQKKEALRWAKARTVLSFVNAVGMIVGFYLTALALTLFGIQVGCRNTKIDEFTLKYILLGTYQECGSRLKFGGCDGPFSGLRR